jgi:hypothetical protein
MSLLNNEMEDVSRSTKSTPIATTTITLANNCLTATNPASAVEIVKQFNQNRSDLINNLKKVEEFYYYKNYYARNPNEIEIVNDKNNYNHEIKEKEEESSKNLFNINNNLNKRLSLSTTNLINKLEDDNNYFKNDSYLFKSNKKLNYDNESTTDESCSINTNDNLTSSASSPISNNTNNNDNITSILDNDDNTSSISSKYSTSKNSIASNKDKLIKDSHDLYSNSNFNSSTLLSNSNINEINLLRTGELVKNLRKKFSPDENNNAFLSYRKQPQQKTTNNNINGNGLLINKHTYQSSKYNNNNNNNNNNHIIKNQQQRSASTASLLINFELKKHKSAANILYENRAITTDVVRTNSTNNKTQFLTNSNKSNNLKPRYNRNIMIENNSNNNNNNNNNNNSEENQISKSKSNNFLNDLVNDKQLTSSCNNNIKNVESDVFENVHIKEKINKFMLNNNNDSFYSVSKNLNNKTIVKKQADRAIFGGSCNNLTALSTSQSIDSNQILNYKQNNKNNHKINDDLSNDSANSTFSDDSSLLENNNNNKVSFCSENSNSEKNMSEDFNKHNINPDYGEVIDNNKTGNDANNSVLFETINFDRVKFEENYNKIKEAFVSICFYEFLLKLIIAAKLSKFFKEYFNSLKDFEY